MTIPTIKRGKRMKLDAQGTLQREIERTPIIDAHAHIFPEVCGTIGDGLTRGLGYGRIAIGETELQLFPPYGEKTTFTPEMMLANMDWAGVDKAVLLQGPFYGECNRYVLDALTRYPSRFIGAAYLDPWGEACHEAFDKIMEASHFRAIKLECSEATGLCSIHPEARLDAPDIAWLWDEIERAGLVLVLDLGAVGSRSYQTSAVRTIAEKHPNLQIVIAHLGQPRPTAEADKERWHLWQEQIDLGLFHNVWFDNSALPAYLTDEGYPYPSAERYMRMAIERIGSAKIMWGTDQPGLLSHANYPQLVALSELHTPFLSAHERAMFLGGTALHVYG
jgi:predicted TIM-barrel fold metal-dependent hydrolase